LDYEYFPNILFIFYSHIIIQNNLNLFSNIQNHALNFFWF
jgi:hypothetical protein